MDYKATKKNPQWKWIKRWLDLAEHYASWSKDPSTKVGAVIVDDKNRLVSIGYNGMPQGLKNEDSYLNDRELKYKTIIHAEINALIFAQKTHADLSKCTLYTFPFLPCSNCMSIFLQSGIKTFITLKNDSERWKDSFEISRNLALDMNDVSVMEVEWYD